MSEQERADAEKQRRQELRLQYCICEHTKADHALEWGHCMICCHDYNGCRTYVYDPAETERRAAEESRKREAATARSASRKAFRWPWQSKPGTQNELRKDG